MTCNLFVCGRDLQALNVPGGLMGIQVITVSTYLSVIGGLQKVPLDRYYQNGHLAS